MKILTGIATVLGTILLVALITALPTMWLWNYLMPDLFGLVEIGFWKALCIAIFSGILFKGTNNK